MRYTRTGFQRCCENRTVVVMEYDCPSNRDGVLLRLCGRRDMIDFFVGMDVVTGCMLYESIDK